MQETQIGTVTLFVGGMATGKTTAARKRCAEAIAAGKKVFVVGSKHGLAEQFPGAHIIETPIDADLVIVDDAAGESVVTVRSDLSLLVRPHGGVRAEAIDR